MEEMFKKNKKIRFSGSGASHQNRVAGSAIKTLVTTERTTLMNAVLGCPEKKLSTDILPTEMDYSVWVYNRILGMQSGLSDIEIWSRSRFEPVSETPRKFHVWGCPTYVLEPKLQKP